MTYHKEFIYLKQSWKYTKPRYLEGILNPEGILNLSLGILKVY